jgi:signal transduction histidine kinase
MNESKRMSSIARKLNWLWIRKFFVTFLAVDVILIVFTVFGWCYSVETSNLGKFKISTERRIDVHEKSKKVDYILTDKDGSPIVISADPFIQVSKPILTGILIVEGLFLIQTLLFGTRQIRRKLKPLHEIAQKAEELSSIAFDEKKFQSLEDAISHLSPNSPDAILHTDDKDLQGIEIALNNLLERMRASYQQQARFVSDASHELRTPIAVVKGYVDMLDRWGKDDATVLDESIQAIKHESDHMNKLVEQLLFLARGDSGRNQMTFKDFALTDMLREVYEESVMIDPKHQYEFYSSENIIVNGDSAMLKQTARILIDNAAKYTNQNDTITIRTGVNEKSEPFFSVQDNGIGMCEADVSHMFERFYRADPARNHHTNGTGLGLSIAKWIVDKHQGYFDILSRADIGTRITVIIMKNE